jgi:PAS domain S-box-containing protein
VAESLLNILLVEDDEDDSVLLTSLLREIPGTRYTLRWEKDFNAALARLAEEKFDAVLVDFRLGERNGLEFIQEGLRRQITAAMILLTGQSEQTLDIDALGAGASDFLRKSHLNPDLLERSIRYSVYRKRSEQDRVRLMQEQAARERAEAATEAVREYALLLEAEIAERRRIEEALRESEESFRQLADAMPQIVWSTRPEGGAGYLNSRWYEYTGLSRDDTFTQDVWQRVIHPEDLQNTQAAWRESMETGRPLQLEFRLRQYNARYRWHLARAVAIRDEQGRITRWYGTATDIDDHKRAEQAVAEHAKRLAASNAELESFAYVASHDLKEPLRGISAYAEMLLEDLGPVAGAEERDKLETLVRLCKRMYDLLDSLLELSRVGRAEVAMSEVDAGKVVGDVLEQLRTRLEQEHAQVRVGELPTVHCDRVRLNQIFSNLVVNAIKYNTSDVKRIEIGAEPQADPDAPPVFFVKDNGIGIAERHRDAVFRVFRRLHPRDAYGGGTGIGLAIVKKIIQQHGGRIWLESAPGQGTTFFFTLAHTPSADDFPALSAAPESRNPAGREAGLHEPRRTTPVSAEPQAP